METKNLRELRSLRAEQVEQAEKAVEAGKPEEAQDALEEIKKLDERITAVEEEIKELTDKEKGSKDEASKEEPVKQEGEQRSMNQFKPSVKQEDENKSLRSVAEFIKTKGEVRAGLVSDDVGVLIPEDISYDPQREVKTVQNLADFVNKVQVKSASGKHPVKNRATAKFHTVAELEANPQLAKPDFTEVPYEVATYRGSIPLSEESIMDSAINLTSLVQEDIQEQKINTLNEEIGKVFKSFPAKTVKDVKDLKFLTNVSIDPGYDKQVICTQSFYQQLDVLVDGNGRFLLQDSIVNNSGNKLLGMNVTVVRDDILGAKNGDAVAFIGDPKRGVFMADRSDISLTYADSNIYGKYLMGAFRFDVVKSDENAGFYVTFEAPAETPVEDGAGA